MPNKKTFCIKPIKELINEEIKGDYIDPFPYPYKQDAVDFLRECEPKDFGLFDPPYSPRQLKEMYGGAGLDYTSNASYWSNLKKEIGRVVKKDGKVMSFGWNSGGIGKKYGFFLEEILLVPHGGQHNDTIVTLERKL